MKKIGLMIIGIGAALNSSNSESLMIAIFATTLIITGVWFVSYITFNKEE